MARLDLEGARFVDANDGVVVVPIGGSLEAYELPSQTS